MAGHLARIARPRARLRCPSASDRQHGLEGRHQGEQARWCVYYVCQRCRQCEEARGSMAQRSWIQSYPKLGFRCVNHSYKWSKRGKVMVKKNSAPKRLGVGVARGCLARSSQEIGLYVERRGGYLLLDAFPQPSVTLYSPAVPCLVFFDLRFVSALRRQTHIRFLLPCRVFFDLHFFSARALRRLQNGARPPSSLNALQRDFPV